MSRPSPISGFPEWLPPQRIIEQQVIGRIQRTFELYGYAPLETRAVEPLDQLLRKGETSKEVYVLQRLQGDQKDASDASLGLHFDLTVPFARYVLENAGKLQFPFRRYQIQKCWRGERPQEGRYREFIQADIDVVDRGKLAGHHEAELPLVIADALGGLPIPPIRIQVNNRKLLQGFCRGAGIADIEGAIRAVDKLDKIGPNGVSAELGRIGATDTQVKAVLALAEISTPDASFAEEVQRLGFTDPLLDEGVAELAAVIEAARAHAPGMCYAELRIARGLDYYTGTVYETQLQGYERHGSICSGGRYDNLATAGDERYPGVGISIGVSRILGLLLGRGGQDAALTVSRSVPTCVLIALPSEADRAGADRVAATLRARGIATEVSPTAAKFGKQIRYAQRRGIPYVWFPAQDGPGGGDSVKDIRSGEQVDAAAADWSPPSGDLYPTVSRGFD